MYRIAVVTPDAEQDWHSRELLKAASNLADCAAVDPISFEVQAGELPSIRVNGGPADAYDAYIIRALNRLGEIDYQYDVFELLERRGKLLVNSLAGLSLAESKAQTTFCLREAGLPVPRAFATQDPDQAVAAVRAFGMAVIKPLYGSHGIGVEKLDHEANVELLSTFLDEYGAVYIQEYIPNQGRDIRAFVVGDEIPAAVYRVAREGEWKTNVFQGSTCLPCELSPALRELCLEAARIVGLDYTGVDLIEGPDGPMILELNGTPSWQGLFSATNRNVAVDVVNRVLQMLDAGRCARQPA